MEGNGLLRSRFPHWIFYWVWDSGRDALEGRPASYLGLTGNLYYIVLLPLALASAAFLFGVMQTYAHYKGKQFRGVLELSGPIVGAALVVIGGFFLVPNQTPFDFTVFVHGENGRQDLLLKNSGQVVLDLNNQRRKEKIGDNGEAYFVGVAPNFRGQKVPCPTIESTLQLLHQYPWDSRTQEKAPVLEQRGRRNRICFLSCVIT